MINILFSVFFYLLIYNVSVMPEVSSPDPLNNWQFYMDIHPSGHSSYKTVFFDETIYENAQKDFSDLRIVDDRNRFVPYYVQNNTYKKKPLVSIYATDLTIDYTLAKDYFYEYRIIAPKNAEILANKIVFHIPEQKFSKSVQISGSYDGIFWNFITIDSIYQISDFKKNAILFKDEYIYRYYQVKIINSPLNITIDDVEIVYDENEARKNSYIKDYYNYQITQISNETRIFLPFKEIERLKIQSLELIIEGNYNRSYEVYILAKDNKTKLINSGVIYNIQFLNSTIADSTISLPVPITSQPIEIRIKNQDDLPLTIKKIRVKYLADKVVFLHNGSSRYRLYFGNPNTTKPFYDIELFKNITEYEYQNICKLSPLKNVQTEKKQSFLDGFISLVDLIFIEIKKLLKS